jgi:hypothetical protein
MKTVTGKVMTKAQARVAIARDVIEQLRAGKLAACHLGFVHIEGNSLFHRLPTNAPTQLGDYATKATCQVCGIGGMLIGYARMFDGVRTKDYFGSDNRREFIHQKLGKAGFSKKQMELVESAFETDVHHYKDIKAARRAQELGYQYADCDDRLTAIMKNIVKNKGTFKP